MKGSLKTLATWLILGTIFFVLISAVLDNSNKKMNYSELILAIQEDKVEKIEISSSGSTANITMKNTQVKQEVNIPNIEAFMNKANEILETRTFDLEIKSESTIITILSILSPFAIIVVFFALWFMFMRNSQGGNKTMTFGKSKARLMGTSEKNKINFKDVAGVDEEKEELQEIVEFLKAPKKFTDMGARIPKGVLLVGAPGTRKNVTCKSSSRRSGSAVFHN